MGDVRIRLLQAAVLLIVVRLGMRLVPKFRASQQIGQGRYALARVYLERVVACPASWLHLPWMGVTPDLHLWCAFNLAVCDVEEGHFDDAIARLRPLRTRDRMLADAVEATLGLAILLAEKNAGEAREHLERVVGRRGTTNLVLLLSHALLSEGDAVAAHAMFMTSSSAAPRSIRWGAFVRFESIPRAPFTEALLRGWFLFRTGEREQARPLLARASTCRVPNLFSRMAVEIAGTAASTPFSS